MKSGRPIRHETTVDTWGEIAFFAFYLRYPSVLNAGPKPLPEPGLVFLRFGVDQVSWLLFTCFDGSMLCVPRHAEAQPRGDLLE